MINGDNFFGQPIKDNKVTYGNIRKIATGKGNDYTAGCLLGYTYFKDSYKMISADLTKLQALMQILEQISKLILQQIQVEQATKESISFLKKEKKLHSTFHKEL